ncbi:T9SS type A sorting domain-containing protein [Persicobacter diffluens]|uniref:Secretion system C-terminal sorting domain-containing protein n=1 Tax=Persicobacter diffluens TaxID=981 RepID=A0AAN5AL39_9BACT|nr:hypothetical protein PEDI_30090 [Persicobacter diffluens]
MRKFYFVWCAIFFSTTSLFAQLNISDYDWLNGQEVAQFEKLSLRVKLAGADFTNPHNSADIKVDASILLPSGEALHHPMFYEGADDQFSYWMLHYAPQDKGDYQLQVKAVDGDASAEGPQATFKVNKGNGHGFLRMNQDNQAAFQFDDGSYFRAVGQNVGWEARLSIGDDPKYTYDYWFPALKAEGMNFVRTWINAPWNIPLDWKAPVFGRYDAYDGEGFHPQGIERMDFMLEEARKNDIYLMVCMDYHGALWVNDNDNWGNNFWKDNVYNRVNGGPCDLPEEFFTHEEAKRMYKDRLRYFIARWGYDPTIGVIELWNEVDNTIVYEGQNISEAAVVAWHQEMVDYLKAHDPYQHLISTSISHNEVSGLFGVSGLDFSQFHTYGASDKDFSNTYNYYNDKYPIGTVAGEIGSSFSGVAAPFSNEVDFLHAKLWLGLFQDAPILPMTWWWEAYDKEEGNGVFGPIAAFVERMGLGEKDQISGQLNISTNELVDVFKLSNNEEVFLLIQNQNSSIRDLKVMLGNMPGENFNYQFYDVYNNEYSEWAAVSRTEAGNLFFTVDELAGNEQIVIILKTDHVLDHDDPLGLNDLKVYPNPVKDFFQVQWYSSLGGSANIELWDMQGRRVWARDYQIQVGLNQLQAKGLSLFPGAYILKVRNGKEVRHKKLLVG